MALQVADHTAREAVEALTELEARLVKRAADAAVKRVCEALQVGNGAAGLQAYLALSDVERESVRQRAPDPALSWLEHMNVGTKQVANAVEAVNCLREVASLRESDPEAFLQAVSGHHLRQVPDFRSWIARAHAMLRDRRERSALDAMALARAARPCRGPRVVLRRKKPVSVSC